jgi:hypothetical protein
MISYPPLGIAQAAGVDARNVTITTTSSQIIAPNPNRASGGMIVNNTTKVMWLRLSDTNSPALANNASSFAIPANGGNYRMPESYIGPVQGFVSAVFTGQVQFVEPVI